MKMSGVQAEYITARRVLLDVLEALKDHRAAVILVGAQAIYLHTGPSHVAVAEFTTDADLALDPAALAIVPDLEESMRSAGFTRQADQPGIWWSSPDNVEVDLMVPQAVGGPGARGARLQGHGKMVARKARGLEAALIDRQEMDIPSLDPADTRIIRVSVAGPAALLVAKLHKLWERRDSSTRLDDKDAHDVYRLLMLPTQQLSSVLKQLRRDQTSAEVTSEALTHLEQLFGTDDNLGVQMAARHEGVLEDFETTVKACVALTQDLLTAIQL